MALEHAILVSLAEKSASGYDLARRFDASIAHFWQASHQQIYKVLARMENDTWVESHLVAQGSRPDKKVYAITTEGRAEIVRWSAEPTPIESLRSEFAVKLRGIGFGNRTSVVDDVRRRHATHTERLTFYEANAARNYPDTSALGDDEVGPYLTLRGGILAEQAGIAWCEEILQAFERENER